jgi:hypothetical protein
LTWSRMMWWRRGLRLGWCNLCRNLKWSLTCIGILDSGWQMASARVLSRKIQSCDFSWSVWSPIRTLALKSSGPRLNATNIYISMAIASWHR